MKRVLFIFGLMMLLTGCDVNYTVMINEDESFDEKVTMSFFKTSSDNDFSADKDDKTPISVIPNENKFYNYEIIDKGNTYDMVYTYKHNIDSIKTAYFLANCYPEMNITNNDEEIVINSGDGFACFKGDDGLKADSVKINIKTNLKVLKNNADVVNGNTYTWNINENNYFYKNIYFKLERVNNGILGTKNIKNGNVLFLIIIIIFSFIIIGSLIYLYVRYKRNKNNEI